VVVYGVRGGVCSGIWWLCMMYRVEYGVDSGLWWLCMVCVVGSVLRSGNYNA